VVVDSELIPSSPPKNVLTVLGSALILTATSIDGQMKSTRTVTQHARGRLDTRNAGIHV